MAGGPRANGTLQRTLVAAQVAISFVLLCAAAVLVRSFIATQRADLGIARKPLLTVWVSGPDVPRDTIRTAVERVRGLAGVTAVAVAIRAPLSLSGGGRAQKVFLPGAPVSPGAAPPDVKFNAVSADYFSTVGTRLLRGRVFTEADERPGEGAVVINDRFAREFFPGVDPLGAIVRLGSATGPEHRIVGIVANAVVVSIGETPEPYFYVPFWRGSYGELTLLVDSSQDPVVLSQPIRTLLMNLHPQLEPRRMVTMPEYIRYSSSVYQATAALGAALGLIGLVLTALGVYGVIAYQTARRTREIGIRLALGGARTQVLRLVLRDGLRLTAAGLLVGIPAALAGTRLIASMLFGTEPWDVAAFVAAGAVLVIAVSAATLLPARRAVRVSPSTALRDA